ncbi:unnamed protein product, partial [Rotaria sordida]
LSSALLKIFNLIENKDVFFLVSIENRFHISEPLQSVQVKPNLSFERRPSIDLTSTVASYFIMHYINIMFYDHRFYYVEDLL